MKAPFVLLIAVAGFGIGIAADRWMVSRDNVAPAEIRAEQGEAIVPQNGEPGTNNDQATGSRKRGGEEGRPRSFAGSIDELRAIAGGGDRRAQSNRIHGALHHATADDLRRLAGEIAAMEKKDPADRELRAVVLRRLAEVDPMSALAAVLDGGEPDFRIASSVVHTAFAELARSDFSAAEAALDGLTNSELRHSAVGGMADGVADSDPMRMANLLDRLPDGQQFDGYFRDWAMRDAAAASAYALATEAGTKRGHWLRSVASGWAVADADAALGWARSLDTPGDRLHATQSVVETMARIDPANAAALIADLPSGHWRRDVVEHLSSNWAQQDPGAALAWAEGLSGSERATAIDQVLRHWADFNPVGASSYVQSLPISERSLDSVHRVARAWADADRDAALAWANTLEDPATRERALGGVASVWTADDPVGAAQFAGTLPAGDERRSVLNDVARRWSNQDPAAAMLWAQELPAADRTSATRAIMDELAEHDPQAASVAYSRFAADPPEGGGFENLAGHIAGRWSRFEPAEAAAWAGSLPEGHAQRRAVEEVAQHWVRADSGGASQWISELPAGEIRDAAARQLVQEITTSDPEAAFLWANSMGDTGHRVGSMRHVLSEWGRSDPIAARAALEGANLSPEQRQQLGRAVE